MRDRVALRLVNYFEKRVVRRSWFEIGDSSLTDRTGEGGADHLEQRRGRRTAHLSSPRKTLGVQRIGN